MDHRQRSGHRLHRSSYSKRLLKEKTIFKIKKIANCNIPMERKPGAKQSPGTQPNQPVQQKQESLSGQPMGRQSAREKHNQERKTGFGVTAARLPSSRHPQQTSK